MWPLTSRRAFVRHSAKAALAVTGLGLLGPSSAHAIQPLSRKGSARLLLSLAAYSFRDYFRDSSHRPAAKPAADRQLDLLQFVDYCADHGCAGTELTSYYFPQQVDNGLLLQLKRHAFLRGVAISGTAVGNTFTLPPGEKRDREIASVKTWIDRAQLMGAPHIRVFAGTAQGIDKAEARKLAIAGLEECCEYAGTRGVLLGLENHGGIVAEAEDLLEIVRAVASPWFGVNLDTGNFHTDDPYADLERCAPYAVNVQVKTEIQRRGQKKEPADLPRLIKILRDAHYQGFVALEYEAAEDPWQAVPRSLARLAELCRPLA
jgi:sugar phosphate isomerase/epimerase